MQPAYETWRTAGGRLLDQIEDPQAFSREVEFWHSAVHSNPLYPEIMDPSTNIWTWRFWALHHRIDEEFKSFLRRLRPGEPDVEKIYESLNASHATV